MHTSNPNTVMKAATQLSSAKDTYTAPQFSPSAQGCEPKCPQYLESMLKHYMPIVRIVVAKMRYKLPQYADLEELHSVGIMGLIDAIQKFDASRGFAFQTYATIRVRGAILDELRALDPMTRTARRDQRRVEDVLKRLEQNLGRAPTDTEMSDALGMSLSKFRKVRSRSRSVMIVSLDDHTEDNEYSLLDILPAENELLSSEQAEVSELLELAVEQMEALPYRQLKVLDLYYFQGLKLIDIARYLGISEARVSQIRTQALGVLRKHMTQMLEVAS